MKLTSVQKVHRKEMRDALPRGSSLAWSEDSGVAALLVPDGNVDRVYTAVYSLYDETRAYRKTGEYLVLKRWMADPRGGTILPAKLFEDASEFLNQSFMEPSTLWTAEGGKKVFNYSNPEELRYDPPTYD